MATTSDDKVLSRDFDIEVNRGTVNSPTWTQINGLDEDGIVISKSNRQTDFMDADDAGLAKPFIIGRGYVVTLKGARIEDAADGTRDIGQAVVEAVMDGMGVAGMLQFKISSPAAATPETLLFSASVECTEFGGADKSEWGCELHVYGAIERGEGS